MKNDEWLTPPEILRALGEFGRPHERASPSRASSCAPT
jgi:hypothetical protein